MLRGQPAFRARPTYSDNEEGSAFLERAQPDDNDAHEHAKRRAPRSRLWSWLGFGSARAAPRQRRIAFDEAAQPTSRFPPNVVRNQKYNVVTFLPMVLYQQFKFFFNLYFLLVALSQFVPALKIGFLLTYILPLTFVLCVTIGKEAFDDYERYRRDTESNSMPYAVLGAVDTQNVGAASHMLDVEAVLPHTRITHMSSSKLRVGDIVVLHKNQRVPADMVLLKTYVADAADDVGSEPSQLITGDSKQSDAVRTAAVEEADVGGTCFIRTDQLDGETDWKLRIAVPLTHHMSEEEIVHLRTRAAIVAGPPSKDLHAFSGNLTLQPRTASPDEWLHSQGAVPMEQQAHTVPLTTDNTLWANTVLAAGRAIGFVVYTGRETRAVMNTSHPQTKVSLLDMEINRLSKILCCVTLSLSITLVGLNGFRGKWWIYIFRFLILFSSIIPISLRVNLDMGKTVYAHQIQSDKEIPGTIVRTSTLPEELGRVEYLLSDKTGTLTQNVMEVKRLHLGTMSYSWDSMDEVRTQLAVALGQTPSKAPARRGGRAWRDMSARVYDVVTALALCHNVTPVVDEDGSVTYQASSPDEVAIVEWTESVGLALNARDQRTMQLRTLDHGTLGFDILEIFPFTSERKRMGIVVRDRATGDISFYLKGADVVMGKIVTQNDWLEEETGNMAREGLRTLVIARLRLSKESWHLFERAYAQARIRVEQRDEAMAAVVAQHLEQNMELLGLTGVEDKLQEGVKTTLELLRNASIKIWMLTGDKIETATCIAISTKLVARNQYIHQVAKLGTVAAALDTLVFLQSKLDSCLVIDGDSLQFFFDHFCTEFVELATQLSVVVACRCSPTQKAEVTKLIRSYTNRPVCCIGDGGNDVSMIQAANIGVGIVGKEGRQASLAADFSVKQFSHLGKLLLWHGRNSYQRSAKLAQFVIHRGLIISIIQAVFSAIFFFAPIALYQGWLMVGYATIYTMAPVFSLVLDRDISEDMAMLYPELYKDLTKGRSLSGKTFTTWLMISVYQGGAIMIASLLLFENQFLNIVGISFTALVLNELIMVALEITTWHVYMVLSEVATLLIYCFSIVLLPEYFDLRFVLTYDFFWKTAIIVLVSSLPLYLIKAVRARLSPPSYSKLSMS
ncbi:P-type phospholipid transporter [Malassezia vespertilionis]|uniref:Phospholipid-transporting ATPase n=1 Tax=Malassezia vespertilionis TaxID=2020962 RepID=A0A2N1JFQ9_9BASI|nr:P-type phospholipid transporter [Malassezia vespertilionis]PKI85390.1 Neo1p [Malassezia vespertilionis]WFD04919.1 P-type phospholipid transporter [Malassezia vespertilionis]